MATEQENTDIIKSEELTRYYSKEEEDKLCHIDAKSVSHALINAHEQAKTSYPTGLKTSLITNL